MNIFIYSDESGVLDKIHNDYFVFGGLMFLSKDDRDDWSRKYIHAERTVRIAEKMPSNAEVKASSVSNKSKGKLYRSLNAVEKFGVAVHQQRMLNSVFESKKTKQRYLDWVFKIGIKEKFQRLIAEQSIDPNEVENLYFFVDEHTTATAGLYELEEALEQEFKYGTHNFDYMRFYPPIFPKLQQVCVRYCNSTNVTLVRAADIVANHIYHEAIVNNGAVAELNNLYIKHHPGR